jgi:hypothetical protein
MSKLVSSSLTPFNCQDPPGQCHSLARISLLRGKMRSAASAQLPAVRTNQVSPAADLPGPFLHFPDEPGKGVPGETQVATIELPRIITKVVKVKDRARPRRSRPGDNSLSDLCQVPLVRHGAGHVHANPAIVTLYPILVTKANVEYVRIVQNVLGLSDSLLFFPLPSTPGSLLCQNGCVYLR